MIDQSQYSFIRRCVSDILNGLSDGLTHFSGTSRAAVIFAMEPDSPLLICDPQNLLKGHEPIFNTLYLENQKWRMNANVQRDRKKFTDIIPVKDLGLAGLLSGRPALSRWVFRIGFLSAVVHRESCRSLLHRTDRVLA